MRIISRVGLAASLASLQMMFGAAIALADFSGTNTHDGVQTVVTQAVMDRAKNGLDLQTGEPDKRVWEYTSSTTCQLSTPGGADADLPCASAVQACAGNTPQQGLGPQVQLWRRELDAKGVPISVTWDPLGTTCSPESVPGKPVLGMGLIVAAFHNTPWALPTVHIQPEGNITLVTLPTFFEVTWPAAGFRPGQIDTVTLMGRQVRIRPTGEAFTYVFGDETSSGPTSSTGGTYPEGDITHVYAKAGVYDTHIDITYGGEFSVEGGAWIPIPDTVNKTGTVQPLTVKTAHAQLVIK